MDDPAVLSIVIGIAVIVIHTIRVASGSDQMEECYNGAKQLRISAHSHPP